MDITLKMGLAGEIAASRIRLRLFMEESTDGYGITGAEVLFQKEKYCSTGRAKKRSQIAFLWHTAEKVMSLPILTDPGLRPSSPDKQGSGWIEANYIVKSLAKAIKDREWNHAAGLLRDEMAIRRDITPDVLIPITSKLIDLAEDTGCGARFAGAGGGGSVWALGEPHRIRRLRKIWETALAPVKGAGILDCAIDHVGVR